jgi:hypothetical protein
MIPTRTCPLTGVGIQEFPDFSSRRSFSSSRSRLYFFGSSIVRDGGAIGLRIFAIKPPARCFFGLRWGMLRLLVQLAEVANWRHSESSGLGEKSNFIP